MRHARPLLRVFLVMIVFWAILAWFWPTAVLYYFAIAGGLGIFFALAHDAIRKFQEHRRP